MAAWFTIGVALFAAIGTFLFVSTIFTQVIALSVLSPG